MNLDVAGEYLVMAATLTHIKSRMLLPPSEDETEEPDEDPRADLVHQLRRVPALSRSRRRAWRARRADA